MAEQKESRRVMHLICEHRRRNAIQTGIDTLRELLQDKNMDHRTGIPVKDTKDIARKSLLSRVEVMVMSVRTIERLRLSVLCLEKELASVEAENARLRGLRGGSTSTNQKPSTVQSNVLLNPSFKFSLASDHHFLKNRSANHLHS